MCAPPQEIGLLTRLRPDTQHRDFGGQVAAPCASFRSGKNNSVLTLNVMRHRLEDLPASNGSQTLINNEVAMNLARKFASSPFARFINSRTGRTARIIAGSALIIWGLTHLDQGYAYVYIVAGLFPLAAGSFDLCLISPLLGGPIAGDKVRSAASKS